MEFLENMNKNEATSVRQEEITGKEHMFHSLPKEFQAWHNTQYMLEKKIDIDESTVPDALLNAYMWKTIGDSTKYALATAAAIIASVIKLKLSPNIWGLAISLLILVPWVAYLVYHFLFYAKIKAQVVGPVTKRCAFFTADTFSSTFYAVLTSLLMTFLYIMWIFEDIAAWIHLKILSMGDPSSLDSVDKVVRKYLIDVYNAMVQILTPPDNAFDQLLYNTYFSTIFFSLLVFLSVYLFEKKSIEERRKSVEEELIQEELQRGYPIDSALIVLKKWKEEQDAKK